MSGLEFHQYPYGGDNYGVLVHDVETGATASIDSGDANATLAALGSCGWTLSHLLLTHHHGDHTAGTLAVKKATGCKVIGPAPLSSKIDGLDEHVNDGDVIDFAGHKISVIHTPGHTTDMMNYHFVDAQVVFTGDTLFAMGCGRLFEGDAEMMFNSMRKLAKLPPQTTVYCSHEYTETNARFASDVDPENPDLKTRVAKVKALRSEGKPTIPCLLSDELATNPFLRTSSADIRRTLELQNASDIEVFSELRDRRNQY